MFEYGALGTSTMELSQRKLHNKQSGTSTTVDFLYFLVIKSKKFRHIRVPHIEKSRIFTVRGIKGLKNWIFSADFLYPGVLNMGNSNIGWF